MTTFKDLGLSKAVLRGAKSAGYDHPMPIQAAAIPIVKSGKDLIGCAQTGTGKTAAFVMPLLDRLVNRTGKNRQRVIRALVLVPTRELALQVETAARTYGKHTHLKSIAVFGGVGIFPQIKKIRQGVDLVVATPGRLLDHLDRKTINLSRVEMLILDEADRMLDMGFIHDIRKVVAAIPAKRQTLCFSATMPKAVRTLVNSISKHPQYLEIGKRRNPAKTVAQQVCLVEQTQKIKLLTHLLDHEQVENVIVFSRTKHRADRIARKLARKGFETGVLHSNRSQAQRERTLKSFRAGRIRILVATNIASRGIDVSGISHVFNYDTPMQPEEYIHRIGRTGRADNEGDAITFVGEGEFEYLKNIERHIDRELDRLEIDGLTVMQGHPITQESTDASKRKKHVNKGFRHKPKRQQRAKNGRPYGRQSSRTRARRGSPRKQRVES